ncbi:MAG: ABC transporter permease [Chloroflexi bacterium]|nr:ABC transporter permease [Chloroflexota bacterium]
MLRRILEISRVDIYNTFTDRAAIMINIAVPLAISIIIGAALGGGSSDISIQDASVGIVNQDDGNFGAMYTCLMVQDLDPAIRDTCATGFGVGGEDDAGDSGLSEFIDGEIVSNIIRGRQMVDEGELDVLLIIPRDYSDAIFTGEQAELEVYYNPGSGVPVDVARTIIQGIADRMNTSALAGAVIPEYVSDNFDDIPAEQQFNLIGRIQQETFTRNAQEVIALERKDIEGEAEEFVALQYFAPSMAIFFMTFGMAAGAISILEDMRDWTMQRIITTPTTRPAYMAGKTGGTYISGLFQMGILIAATLLVNRFIFNDDVAVWGSDIAAIVLLVLSVVAAATGLGMVIASLGRNSQQVQSVSTILLITLATVGGTFIPVDDVAVINQLRKLTLNHWAIDGFTELSMRNGSLPDVIDNIAILFVMAAITLGVAIYLFNQREDFKGA